MRAFLGHEHPLRLAHRGSTVLWPENTMTAFQGAIDLGFRYLESDIHRTADGFIIVFHDDRLERVTNGAGRIADWRYEDLRHLDAGYWFGPNEGFPYRGGEERIPTLEEVLGTWPDVLLNVDLKQSGIEESVIELIEKLGAWDRLLIASFRDGRLGRFRRLARGRVATSAGPRDGVRLWLGSKVGRAPTTQADCYQLPVKQGPFRIDQRLVDAAHAADRQVHAWVVNDGEEMTRLLDIGVDGLVTDRPDVLNQVIATRRPGE